MCGEAPGNSKNLKIKDGLMRRFLIVIVVTGLFGLTIYVFRTPLLQSIATNLIVEDPLQKSEAMFVLSGGAYDRGNEAGRLFKLGYANRIICTGGNPFVEL